MTALLHPTLRKSPTKRSSADVADKSAWRTLTSRSHSEISSTNETGHSPSLDQCRAPGFPICCCQICLLRVTQTPTKWFPVCPIVVWSVFLQSDPDLSRKTIQQQSQNIYRCPEHSSRNINPVSSIYYWESSEHVFSDTPDFGVARRYDHGEAGIDRLLKNPHFDVKRHIVPLRFRTLLDETNDSIIIPWVRQRDTRISQDSSSHPHRARWNRLARIRSIQTLLLECVRHNRAKMKDPSIRVVNPVDRVLMSEVQMSIMISAVMKGVDDW